MAPEVSDAEKAAIEGVTGPDGEALKLRLIANPTAPPPGAPASQIVNPYDYLATVRDGTQMLLRKKEPGSEVTAEMPSMSFDLAKQAGASQPITGWAITTTQFGSEVVVNSALFDKPIVPTPNSVPLVLEPTLSFVVDVPATGPTLVVAGANAPPRKRGGMKRRAFLGTRRLQVQALKRCLKSLGLWDGREGDHAEAGGYEGIYFVDSADTESAVETLLQRVQECLDAVR